MSDENTPPEQSVEKTDDNQLPEWLEEWMDEHKGLTLAIAAAVVVALAAAAFPWIKGEMADQEAGRKEYVAEQAEKDKKERADRQALVVKAEGIVEKELPDVPYWKGTKFQGLYVSREEVCVDRTLKDGSNAGFVVVTLPEGTTGDPQDGTCGEPAPEPVDYAAELKSAFEDELGDSNRDDVDRVESVVYNDTQGVKAVVVTWAIDENVSEGLTKAGAKLDVTKILKILQEQMRDGLKVKTVTFAGTYSLVDQLDNESEDRVVLARCSGDTIEQIDFDNFLHDDVYDVADSATIHPALQE